MKSKPETTEKVTILNGAVITEKVLERIIDFQDHDNEQIKSIRNCIADAIGFIHKNMPSDELRDPEMLNVLTDLSYIRDYYLDFEKP